ncbi:DUF1648 domain-containing protein [Porphyrobacter algicida]|uniref:DUF1648 domain-containing protein n=1 Tax=Qipengyuania algicida TaxID=1836209 RepID=A0A845AGD4_9SPHN|nr:SdpI family protein [Qipengyuania algicida]MXP28704.1 DUF1648 domain-containing protein [Qipengyuania algicida]
MKTKGLLIASLVVAVLMAGFAVLTAQRLPPGTMLPTHWNAAGQPDNFAPALKALLMPPAIAAGLGVFFSIIPRIEPLQDRLEQSSALFRTAWLGVLGVMIVVQLAIGLPGWGVTLPVNAIILAIGVMFIVLGNALPKSRPGFFVGIRTPWTLTDTDVWIATHRLGGKLMMLAGLAIVIASLLPIQPQNTAIVVLVSVGIAALIPTVYSWWLWHQKKARGELSPQDKATRG